MLLWLAKNSTKSLDVIAQYWQLVASPADPRSGDYGYSKEEMKRFGADQGSAVYSAIEDAALRNVSIRCVFSCSSVPLCFICDLHLVSIWVWPNLVSA